MRTISVHDITKTVAKLAILACCKLPDSVLTALEVARLHEPSKIGGDILGQLIENAKIAREQAVPLCQDTGLAIIFADLGQEVQIVGGDFYEALQKGVAQGYTLGFLRKSVVAEPLFERKNTTDNTPAIVHLRLVKGDKLRLCLAPKGAGSENKGTLKLLIPADGLEGVRQVVLDCVRKASANSCPPLVVGVGIGGNMEECCLMAKRACVREIGTANPDPRYHALERDLLQLINQTGIGPQGLGGETTALAVHVEWAPTHIASLPVAVNLNCHAARHAEAIL
ncbi:MAG: fumarate hydratase [Desulfovibrionaceae bacterium]|nr:fumarate hydratase [Desulfovibrionaceae bacterium]